MSSFLWLHQHTGSGFLSFSGRCLAAVSVVCVAQPVFPPAAIFSFKRSAYVGHPISSNERASQGGLNLIQARIKRGSIIYYVRAEQSTAAQKRDRTSGNIQIKTER